MFKTVFVKYLRPHAGWLLLVVVLQTAQAVAALFLPSLNAAIIDQGVAQGDIPFILRTGAIMLGVVLIQVLSTVAAVYFGARAAMGFGRDLRSAMFSHVASLSGQDVAKFGAPTLITRTTNDVQQVQMFVLFSCIMLLAAPVLGIGGVVFAFQQDVQLTWILAVVIPLMLVTVGVIALRLVPLFRQMQRRLDRVNLVLREQLTGIRVIRAFVREPVEMVRFDEANDALTTTAIQTGRLMALLFPVIMAVMNVAGVGVIWFGAFRVEAGMDVGALIAFLTYILQILGALMMALSLIFMLPRAAVSGERIRDVLSTVPSIVVPAAAMHPGEERGSIEVNNAAFTYPGAEKPVLEHMTFSVAPGSTLAIIGSTGAGKTTLVNLLVRLYDITSGDIRIDGVSIGDLSPEDLWERVAYVPQSSYLFSGTVRSNIEFGKPGATDTEIWRALELAQAADFVQTMPDGLDSTIEQGGRNVSGGQRQRLAIARALVKQASINIFDDSFSALDTATDARLRAALAEHVSGATNVIVAQRVSTIMDADLILVLDSGQIVASGTHAELLETSPEYQEIVESQMERDAA